ncbi:hypothetical protein DPMN_042716 [Dreissena polymorpha]|uniref:Uncharacterized protein n=1 Tax=Dreissena polymorpha TaxID=45954 RepID=A0A9D4D0W2_DREPO|nr:hypothetical protein DPMN_042716 [Dreissena polymorpha]
MDGNYNLIRISHGLVYSDVNSVPITKTFFCNMLEFTGDEINKLYSGSVLYIKELEKHFGDMEFVTSRDSNGFATVKVCIEDLPFGLKLNGASAEPSYNRIMFVLIFLLNFRKFY